MFVNLGNVSGTIVLDLSYGATYFKGTVTGNVQVDVRNAQAGIMFFLDLTQNSVGGHTLTFSGGMPVKDPSGFLAQYFTNTSAGSSSIGMWTSDGANIVAMGFNATP